MKETKRSVETVEAVCACASFQTLAGTSDTVTLILHIRCDCVHRSFTLFRDRRTPTKVDILNIELIILRTSVEEWLSKIRYEI